MRVLYDCQAFDMQKYGGVSKCAVSYIKEFKASQDIKCTIGVKETRNVYLQECGFKSPSLLSRLNRRLTRMFDTSFSNTPSWARKNLAYSRQLLHDNSFDIFVPTFYNPYFLDSLDERKPFVLTVHDLIIESFPEYYSRDDAQIIQRRLLCPKAAAIQVPTNSTKEDLVRLLGVEESKIHVIPWAGDSSSIQMYNKDDVPSEPYVLFVGQRGLYKNFTTVLEAFALFHKKYPEALLFCAGGGKFSSQEKAQIDGLGLSDRVVQHYVSDETLANLYHYCLFFVFPSLYEGFGLPVLESFRHGAIALLSDNKCFQEVAGDAAVFFSIKEGYMDLYNKMLYCVDIAKDEKEAMMAKQYRRYRDFSWSVTADMIESLYKSVLR